ncbi:hypothetical protein [Candidatus Nanohalococcus occultus]|uniref:hypothetical protein n=1 Tax=Candidatus Nanohalococcus occultus TaxID=2978047 RepID=UPI0039E0E323
MSVRTDFDQELDLNVGVAEYVRYFNALESEEDNSVELHRLLAEMPYTTDQLAEDILEMNEQEFIKTDDKHSMPRYRLSEDAQSWSRDVLGINENYRDSFRYALAD